MLPTDTLRRAALVRKYAIVLMSDYDYGSLQVLKHWMITLIRNYSIISKYSEGTWGIVKAMKTRSLTLMRFASRRQAEVFLKLLEKISER